MSTSLEIFDVTISSQGQVTVPVALRRRLGLEKGDKLRFVVEGDAVRVMATPWTIESIIGSVAPIAAMRQGRIGRVIDDAVGDELSKRNSWSSHP